MRKPQDIHEQTDADAVTLKLLPWKNPEDQSDEERTVDALLRSPIGQVVGRLRDALDAMELAFAYWYNETTGCIGLTIVHQDTLDFLQVEDRYETARRLCQAAFDSAGIPAVWEPDPTHGDLMACRYK